MGRLPLSKLLRLPSAATEEGRARSASREVLESLVSRSPLAGEVDGKGISLQLDQEALREIISPICVWLHRQAIETDLAKRGQRLVVGVVGPAGSGKSYICAVLTAACNALYSEDGSWAVSLSMDAYHYPNAELESRTAPDPTTGEPTSLKALKGVPQSIDVQALVRDLQSAREPADKDRQLPVYDRTLHDPVANGITLTPRHRLVLVEGLHLLHRDWEWSEVGEALDLIIYLDVPKDVCRPRVVNRKVANGRARDSAEQHFDRVDAPIYDRLQREKDKADLELGLDGHGRLVRMLARRRLVPLPKPWAEDQKDKEKRKMVVLGLNPAFQRVVTLPGMLMAGEVNRGVSAHTGVGGKGQNCSKAAAALNLGLEVTVAHFLGGFSGLELANLLDSLGVKLITEKVKWPTRTCTSIVHEYHGRTVTEIVEPGHKVSGEEQDGLLQKLQAFGAEKGPVHGVAIMGTAPPGVPPDFYVKALQALWRQGTVVLIDTVVGLDGLLTCGVPVALLKLNTNEFMAFSAGCPTGNTDPKDPSTIRARAAHLLSQYTNVSSLGVTAGPAKAYLFQLDRQEAEDGAPAKDVLLTYCYTLPKIPDEELGSPIGAGDTCAGVTLAMLSTGCGGASSAPVTSGDGAHAHMATAPEAFRWGLAAAFASCYTCSPADYNVNRMKVISSAIAVEVEARYL